MITTYYVDTNEFIRRYLRSKYSCKISKDELKNEYYFFTLCSCVVGKIDAELDSFYHCVDLAFKRGCIAQFKEVAGK